MSTEEYERGRTAERLDVNDERHEENKKRLDSIEAKLDGVVEALTLVRGGARLLYSVGVVAAGIGAAASSVYHWLGTHLK